MPSTGQLEPTTLSTCAEFIGSWEGCSLEPYYDVSGYPTIGYGRLLSRKKWAPLTRWTPIDRETAEAWLLEDTAYFMTDVLDLVTVELTDSQLIALTSFTFNLGTPALRRSSLLRWLNEGDYEAAAEEFPRWVYSGGRRVRGLVRRRAAERELFLQAG